MQSARKYDTVIGTIGNTHGVSRAAKPHRIASMMMPHRLLPSVPAASEGADIVSSAYRSTSVTVISGRLTVQASS